MDDEEHIRKDLADYLSHRIACGILQAANGYEALKLLEKNKVDLVLLDLKMPGISGMEVIEKVKSLSKDTAVIVLSKFDSAEISGQIKKAGADYIPKPYSLKVVRAKVEEKLKALGKFSPKV